MATTSLWRRSVNQPLWKLCTWSEAGVDLPTISWCILYAFISSPWRVLASLHQNQLHFWPHGDSISQERAQCAPLVGRTKLNKLICQTSSVLHAPMWSEVVFLFSPQTVSVTCNYQPAACWFSASWDAAWVESLVRSGSLVNGHLSWAAAEDGVAVLEEMVHVVGGVWIGFAVQNYIGSFWDRVHRTLQDHTAVFG